MATKIEPNAPIDVDNTQTVTSKFEQPASSMSPERVAAKPIVVQKYGGSSLADLDKVRSVAQLVRKRREQGNRIVVVVSAMGDTTDALIARAKALTADPPRRELDMLLTAGERVSMALVAMALAEEGVDAVSFTGSQCGILTSDQHAGARILEVRPYRVEDELARDRVVVVGGFQGVSYRRDVTTLGRGGTDTTAVALAAALDAQACEIYSDVDGVYTADPRVVDETIKLASLSYEEMQELATAGAKVLNPQAVQFAKDRKIALFCRKTGDASEGTVVRKDAPPPSGGVRGIAHKERLFALSAPFEQTAAVVGHLRAHGMAPLEVRGDLEGTTILVSPDDAHASAACFASLPPGARRLDDIGAVSAVGEGALEEIAVVERGFDALATKGLTARGVSSSSFRVTFFVQPEDVAAAAQLLHAAFLSDVGVGSV